MTRTVSLPLWLLVLILLFATVTFLSHFFFPSVRWFFRRRMERIVSEINTRLPRPIEPFRLARRFDTVQRLTYDSAVLDAIDAHAVEEGVPKDVALERAKRYAKEIVPSFAVTLYFGVAIRLARWLSKFLYDVRLDRKSAEVIDTLDPEATVVFVMNHRSNMDYVLVTYLIADKSAPSYAVGEWARIWPLSALIRAMGAYFIRRKSRNALYRKVLARYVQIATEAGVTQAMFPEGGLSLTGRIGQAKLGLLSYIAEGKGQRDVIFVPVALTYDRVLEDRVLTRAAASGTRRFRASVPAALRFAVGYLWRRLRGKASRFGIAGVRFGVPLSLETHRAAHPNKSLQALGKALTQRIEAAMPVLPVPLVAWLVVNSEVPVSRETLIAQAKARLDDAALGLGHDAEALICAGTEALLTRKLIVERPKGLEVAPGEDALAAYYAAGLDSKFGNNPVGSGGIDDPERHKITN